MTRGDRKTKSSKHCEKECYDFVIVGAGNAGCILAKRLSENGKYSVCVMDAGIDDARTPTEELGLPLPSDAPVPQPGDFNWGTYVRGTVSPLEFPGLSQNRGFSCFSWFSLEDQNGPVPGRKTTVKRHSGWGGCTNHNFPVTVRNGPYNWEKWVKLGLTDFKGSLDPHSRLVKIYKKVENRSQEVFGQRYFNPAQFNSANPLGPQPAGSFPTFNSPQYYGYNGSAPQLVFNPSIFGQEPFVQTLLDCVKTVLPEYNYPNFLADGDWPPAAHTGGLYVAPFWWMSQLPTSQIVDVNGSKVTAEQYSEPLYPGKPIFNFPPELAEVGFVGPVGFQRSSSVNTYLYPALNAKNKLTVKSSVLVTKVLIKDDWAVGVKYLEGYNIYQTGRNTNTLTAGYGGTVADAKLGAMEAKRNGSKYVFAKKEVILSAGVYNTPQIMQLSGLGDKDDLRALGIKSKVHIPGVGKHLIDNPEFFMQFKCVAAPAGLYAIYMKLSPDSPYPSFNVPFGANGSNWSNESRDITIQKSWNGLRYLPGLYSAFPRNDWKQILLDSTNQKANLSTIVVTSATVQPVGSNGQYSVTFNFPTQNVPPAGGYVVSGSNNPLFNTPTKPIGYVYSSATADSSVTLTYSYDPGTYSGGVILTPPPEFVPAMYSAQETCWLGAQKIEDVETEGTVTVVSKDPTVPPKIIYNFLQAKSDIDDFMNIMLNKALPMLLYLKDTPYFTGFINPMPSDFLKPGVTYDNWTSMDQVDQDRLKNLLYISTEGHHPMGTCKMGVINPKKCKYDPMAVVDQKGRVKGVKGLRICDASIFPIVVAWPQGNLYILAEKISQDILNYYC